MSDATGVKVELDSKELERQLKALGAAVSAKDIMLCLRLGALPILEEAKRLVPVRYGFLHQSIKLRARTLKGESYMFVGVNKETEVAGVETGTGKEIRPHKYAHLVEFATRRGKKKADRKPGKGQKVAKEPGRKAFLRPAFDNKQDEALGRIRAALVRLIERIKSR